MKIFKTQQPRSDPILGNSFAIELKRCLATHLQAQLVVIKAKKPQDLPRLFYFKETDVDFIRQFNEVLAKRNFSLEKILQAISDNFAALIAAFFDHRRSFSPPSISRTVTFVASSQLTLPVAVRYSSIADGAPAAIVPSILGPCHEL